MDLSVAWRSGAEITKVTRSADIVHRERNTTTIKMRKPPLTIVIDTTPCEIVGGVLHKLDESAPVGEAD